MFVTPINHLSINNPAQANQSPDIKKDRPDLPCIHSLVIQNVLKRVALSFTGTATAENELNKRGGQLLRGAGEESPAKNREPTRRPTWNPLP